MKVVIVDYGAGNTRSVLFALERLGVNGVLSYHHEDILSADRVIFPGVGAARYAMDNLRMKQLDGVLPLVKAPFLGICLGMQIMCSRSEEGDTACLGIFPETVVRFDHQLPVPHMGWNNVDSQDKLLDGNDFYFVHSYYVPVSEYTLASASYGTTFSAALRKDNFVGLQFHPEKSGEAGEILLKKFLQDD